jgi:hypothetical protein
MSDLECSEACGGNGYIDCWNCGGEGQIEVPDDDITDTWATCGICRGEGGWPCPACEAREAFGDSLNEMDDP